LTTILKNLIFPKKEEKEDLYPKRGEKEEVLKKKRKKRRSGKPDLNILIRFLDYA
jgi:hypothetical protein